MVISPSPCVLPPLLSPLLVLVAENAALAAPSFCRTDGWSQVWSDEFDGTQLDEFAWTKDVGDTHDSRTRQARATADSVWVEQGALVIRSNGTWDVPSQRWLNLTSGAVTSQGKVAWKGPTRICIRAKLPGGPDGLGTGIWPAHWLMPNDDSCWPCHGEIDIMEMVDGDGHLYGTYHWCVNQTCGFQNKLHSGGSTPMALDWSTEWHEFAVEYGRNGHPDNQRQPLLQYALDGRVYHQVSDPSTLVFPDVPYYAILNTAVGGPWAKPPNPVDARRLQHTHFPTYHLIDWIRVVQPRLPNKDPEIHNLNAAA